MESEKSIMEPFSAMGTVCCGWHDTLCLLCSKTWCFFAVPQSCCTESSARQSPHSSLQGNLWPQPWCNVSQERKLCEALNDWHEWDTTDNPKQVISFYFSQRVDADKINLIHQKALIFTVSICQWENTLISSRSLAQLCLGVCSVLYAPTGRAHIFLMCPLQGLNYPKFFAVLFLD